MVSNGVKSSKDILTFRQLIKLIDKSSWFGGSFFGGCRDANYDDFGENNPEELSHFESWTLGFILSYINTINIKMIYG